MSERKPVISDETARIIYQALEESTTRPAQDEPRETAPGRVKVISPESARIITYMIDLATEGEQS